MIINNKIDLKELVYISLKYEQFSSMSSTEEDTSIQDEIECDIKELIENIQQSPEVWEWESNMYPDILRSKLNELYNLVGLDKTIGIMYRCKLYRLAFDNYRVSTWIYNFTNELLKN